MTTQATIELAELKLKNQTIAQRIENQQKLFEANSERIEFDSMNREIIKYMRPDLSQYLDSSQRKGEKRGTYMYTSKVSTDLERAADAFVGNVFVHKGWFGYAMKETWVNEINEVQKWLQEREEHMYGVFDDTKFVSSLMPPIAMDALSIGDGIIYLGNHNEEDRPYFQYCEIMATYFKRDRFQKLMRVHRVLDICALEAYERWKDKCSDEVIMAAYDAPLKSFKFIHAVYKRDDPILSDINYFDKDRDFIEIYIQKDSQDNRDVTAKDKMAGVVEQDGYHSMPYIDWPYFLKSNENYGRGPLGTALVTVKRLHGQHKTAMLKGQRDAAPPLKASKTLKNSLQLGPDGVTWIKDPAKEIIEEIYGKRGSGYATNIDQIERTEEQIEDVLHLSLYLAMSLVTKQMNNPEVWERIGEKAAMLVPRLGLMNNIFLQQIHDRMWQMEEIADRFKSPPPQILLYLASLPKKHPQHISGKITIRYKGPLVQAQENLFTQRRLMGNLQGVAVLAKFDEQAAADVVDVEKAVEHVLDDGGFWQDAIRDKEGRAERQKLRMQLMMAERKAEVQSKEAGAMKNVAGALKDTA